MHVATVIKVTDPAIPRACGQSVMGIKEIRPRFHESLKRFFSDCGANARGLWLTKRLIRMVNFGRRARVADKEIRAFLVYGA
jgi:hypothetical protein